MKYFIDNPSTYLSVNTKGHAMNEWIKKFTHVILADEISCDAFIEGVHKKASMLDTEFPRTKKLTVSVTLIDSMRDYIQIRVYPEGNPDKLVFIVSIYQVRGEYQSDSLSL